MMKNLHKKCLSGFAVWIVCISAVLAQESSMKVLELDDMSSFEEQDGNWSIVGDVTMSPTIDIHNKKEGSSQAVKYESGEGILLNINSEDKNSQLITEMEHGDIDLTMEVMLPKGSNSGIYLQGRYEIQLLDSWGVEDPKFSDIGGIYRNWESDPDKIYMGKAPLTNAAKAPGLWQTLKISFRAPEFNADGEKVANARFVSVELNGVKIHDNVEVPLPTGGPIEKNEQPKGPLMIQGDHGPVAFRNIKYRLLEDSEVKLDDIAYELFFGDFDGLNDFGKSEPSRVGSLSGLTSQVTDKDTAFAVRYTGNIIIPEGGNYSFGLSANNAAAFSIDGQKVNASGSRNGGEGISLEKGTYPFEILYSRNVLWEEPGLRLTVRSPGKHSKELNTKDSFPIDRDVVNPILVETGSEPKLLRAFLDFKGDYNRRLTHTIAVGGPHGVHYIYDLKAGNIVAGWRGRFIDATSMWYSRGDGSFEPLGLKQYFFTGPSLALLEDKNAAFPEENDKSNFKGKGYKIDEESGRPLFKYIYNGMEVTDEIYPDKENKMLLREVQIENSKKHENLYFKLAESETISKTSNGSFLVGEEYYINILSERQPSIRKVDGKDELILPVDGSPIKYSIIW